MHNAGAQLEIPDGHTPRIGYRKPGPIGCYNTTYPGGPQPCVLEIGSYSIWSTPSDSNAADARLHYGPVR